MGTATPTPEEIRDPARVISMLRKANRQNIRFRKTVEQLNRFVDAVANIAPDVAERAALAVE